MTIKDDVIQTHSEHPDWTAKQIADHLQIERHHVYSNARIAGLKLAPSPYLATPTATVPAPLEPAISPPDDFIVYANTPADMVAAQGSVTAWCSSKIEAEAYELEEAQRNLDAASANGWSTNGWDRQVKLIRQKIDFYEKVRLALAAGYYIVPPFPVDVFAIRTTRKTPDPKATTYPGRHLQEPQILPPGDGRYVSNLPEERYREYPGEPDRNGKPTTIRSYFGHSFEEADFPFALDR